MAVSIRELNLRKIWRNCNRCGKRIFTDRCHHTCAKCNKKLRAQKEPAIRTIRLCGPSTLSWERPSTD